MFRILALAAVVAVAPMSVFVAAPAWAQSAPSVPEVNRLLGQLVDYSQPHQEALTAASGLVEFTLSGMNPLIAAGESKIDRATAAKEIDAWAADLQIRISALKARRAALPAFPEGTVKRLIAMDPRLRRQAESYRQIKVECEKTIDAAIRYAEGAVPLTRAAATGDEAAAKDLVAATFSGVKLTLAAENAMLDVGISAGAPESPQTALAKSIRSSNGAVEVYLDYALMEMGGIAPPPATTAREMRQLADQSRAEARQVAVLAKAMQAQMRAIPDADLRTRMLKLLATFESSSQVEVEVADIIAAAAGVIETGSATPESLDAVISRIDVPMARRLQLQADRLALLKR